MNALIEHTLDTLRDELRAVGAIADDTPGYVLFGSIVMYLHGVRDDIGDVDVFVRPDYWEALSGRSGWRALIPNVDDPPLLVGCVEGGPDIHAFYAWTKRDNWLDVSQCWALAEYEAGWQCVPLVEVRRHKQRAWDACGHDIDAAQAKHVDDIALIDRHLEGATA